jgi:hypothetical protein
MMTIVDLKVINLNECLKIGDEAVDAIARCCAINLQVLRMKSCKQITDVGFSRIAQHCTNLEVLEADASRVVDKGTSIQYKVFNY